MTEALSLSHGQGANAVVQFEDTEQDGEWVTIFKGVSVGKNVRQVLNIPDRMRPLCLVPVGHPAEPKRPRTSYEESKVHYKTFGGQP